MAVYFIEDESGYIKIGYSETPDKRVLELQTGNRQQLKLVAVVPGDEDTERRLHGLFNQFHDRGEWFRPEPQLQIVIAAARVLYGIEETERLAKAERLRGMVSANVPHRDIRRVLPESGNFPTDWIETERSKLNGEGEHIKRLLALPLSQKQ